MLLKICPKLQNYALKLMLLLHASGCKKATPLLWYLLLYYDVTCPKVNFAWSALVKPIRPLKQLKRCIPFFRNKHVSVFKILFCQIHLFNNNCSIHVDPCTRKRYYKSLFGHFDLLPCWYNYEILIRLAINIFKTG